MASFLSARSVPSLSFDVILLAGQSNMSGRGVTGTIDSTPANLKQYSCAPASANFQTIMSGSDPLEMEEGIETGQIGPGHSFGVQYMTNNPTRGVLLVPFAHGSTSLVSFSQEWHVGNSLHETAVTRCNAAITAIQAIYPSSAFAGIAWLQGENDAQQSATESTYATAFDAAMADWRSRITGASSCWICVLGLAPGFISATPGGSGVVAALQNAPTRLTRTVYVAGPSGNDDGLHYNAVAQRILGPNAANAIVGL